MFLETQEGLLHKIRAIIMDSRMSKFKGKLTFVRRAVNSDDHRNRDIFSVYCILVAALTLMQGIVV